jgi:hypothetical protein
MRNDSPLLDWVLSLLALLLLFIEKSDHGGDGLAGGIGVAHGDLSGFEFDAWLGYGFPLVTVVWLDAQIESGPPLASLSAHTSEISLVLNFSASCSAFSSASVRYLLPRKHPQPILHAEATGIRQPFWKARKCTASKSNAR